MFSYLTNHLPRRREKNRPTPRPRRHALRPVLETLEDRTVPALIEVVNGQLNYFAATNVNDNLTISLAGGTYTFNDTADTISLGSGTAGFTGNGTHTVTGPAASFHGIELFFGDSFNTVAVQSTGVNLSVNDSNTTGQVTINVGNTTNGMQSIQGTVADLAASASVVNADDTADTTGRHVTISAGLVSGLAPGPIEMAGSNFKELQIYGGSGGNTFTITGTPANATLNLSTGAGKDVANVQATGAGSFLGIDGVAGADFVTLGSKAPNLFGTLANIHGTVVVGNSAGQTDLTVDDSGDATPSTNVQITDDRITGLGTSGALIEYFEEGIGNLNILGGSGANTFTVLSTGKSRVTGQFTTNIEPGSGTGAATVNVQAAAPGTNLVIDGQASNDTVTLGSNGTLAGLAGMTVAVVDASGGHTALTINDSADTAAQTAFLQTVGPVNNPTFEFLIPKYAPANNSVQVTFAPANLSSLTVKGGSGGNTYNVSAFGNNLSTTLDTGTGNDTVNVQSTGTGTSLSIDGQAGSDTVTLGSKAPNLFGTLANVHGTVTVSNDAGQTELTVDDSGDATPSNVQITSGGITGLGTGGAVIDYVQAGIGDLNVFGGSGANTFTVLSTGKSRVTGEFTTNIEPGSGTGNETVNVQAAAPGTNLVINGQVGNDTVVLGSNGTLAGLAGMTVAVVDASGGHTALTINDSADTAGQTAVLQTVGPVNNPTYEFLIPSYTPTSAAVQITYAPSQLSSLTIDGGHGNNTYNVSDFGAGLATTINTGNGNDAVNVTVDSTSDYRLTMNGGTGTNSLLLNDPSRAATFNPNPAPQVNGTVDANYLAPGVASVFTYTNMGSVTTKPDADHSFVQALFHDVYGRSGSQAELDAYVNELPILGQAGVAATINHTPEAYKHVVTGWFHQFLDEAPAATELAKYSGELAQGATQEHVLGQILATPEFLRLARQGAHEGAAEAFVEALYANLLGVPENRIPAINLAFWVLEVHGLGREGVADAFLAMPGYRKLQVKADYERLLHRAPTAQEVSAWVKSGLDLLSIQIGIESLPEFFSHGG